MRPSSLHESEPIAVRPAYAPRRRCIVAACLIAAASAAAADAEICPGEGCVRVRPQDEALLIDVRGLGCTTDLTRICQGVHAQRLDHSETGLGDWRDISIAEFLAKQDASMPTIVFAHGNKVASREARSRGLWVYGRLLKNRCDDRPMRFVIFSWPSAQIKGLARDARVKASRTRPVAFQLAWLFNQVSPDTQLGLIGYSYGARVLSGASHLLAGGALGGLRLPGEAFPDRPINAVYVASALDSDWLGAGRFHGRSLDQVDSLLVTTNRRDPAMWFYPWLNPKKHAQSLGFEGPTCLARRHSHKVRKLNLSAPVGRTHSMCAYMASRSLMRSAWRRLNFADERPVGFAEGGQNPTPTACTTPPRFAMLGAAGE